jgi:hypothetical protein
MDGNEVKFAYSDMENDENVKYEMKDVIDKVKAWLQ